MMGTLGSVYLIGFVVVAFVATIKMDTGLAEPQERFVFAVIWPILLGFVAWKFITGEAKWVRPKKD